MYGSNIVKILQVPELSKKQKLDLIEKREYNKLQYIYDDKGEYLDKREDTPESEKLNKEIVEESGWQSKIAKFYETNNIDLSYQEYAEHFIENRLKQEGISNKNLYKIMEIIQGDRFLIKAKTKE
jgi:hypothetical protein